MAFRNPITKLSQLIADKITGAAIVGGTIDGTIVTGGTVRTAAAGARVELDSTDNPGQRSSTVRFFTGDPFETGGGSISSDIATAGDGTPYGTLTLASTAYGGGRGNLEIDGPSSDSFRAAQMSFNGVAITQGLLLPSSQQLNGIDFGQASANVAGGIGQAVFHHHLGTPPWTVLVSQAAASGAARTLRVVGFTATTFTVEFRTAADALVSNGSNQTVNYLALT